VSFDFPDSFATSRTTFSRENDHAPPMFTAIQAQLGLKLGPTTMRSRVALVDHIERPTHANLHASLSSFRAFCHRAMSRGCAIRAQTAKWCVGTLLALPQGAPLTRSGGMTW
jgi:uncharacterized protein DUF3738